MPSTKNKEKESLAIASPEKKSTQETEN